jgi:hypothetical protein
MLVFFGPLSQYAPTDQAPSETAKRCTRLLQQPDAPCLAALSVLHERQRRQRDEVEDVRALAKCRVCVNGKQRLG